LASALYDRLGQQARDRGMIRLFVEASDAARRLFIRKGFCPGETSRFSPAGVSIHNYLMEKKLLSGPGQWARFPHIVEIQTDPPPTRGTTLTSAENPM
jgi:hypothetical protein